MSGGLPIGDRRPCDADGGADAAVPRQLHFADAIELHAGFPEHRIRSARDAVLVGVRDGLNLPRLMNWLRRRDFMTGRMEMYWVPRAEVISVVTAAGGRVTDVVEEWTPGYQSCRYWIRKD